MGKISNVLHSFSREKSTRDKLKLMEEDAQKHYALADKLLDERDIEGSNVERNIGNEIMKKVTDIKLLLQ